jgi:replicative DNA helicase
MLMIYRDEQANLNTTDRGIRQAIASKHGNGPAGTAKLLFEPKGSRLSLNQLGLAVFAVA